MNLLSMFRKTAPKHSLLDSVIYFRKFGFFENQKNLSSEDLAVQISTAYSSEYGEEYDGTGQEQDLLLLSIDRQRIWWRDTEADVCAGNDVYVNTLTEWSAISRGTFLPTDISESWASDIGPVTVYFSLNGATYKINPYYMDDYIDMGILSAINELIQKSGRRFESVDTLDQTSYVLMLTAHEKRKLQADRGWKF